MKHICTWVSEWLYEYRRNSIALSFFYKDNTYSFNVIELKLSGYNFKSERAAKDAAIVAINEVLN
jgi:hypothetical protein